jgi:hypothetical protein
VNKKLAARISTIIVSGALIIVGLGQGCGKFTVMGDSSDSAQNSNSAEGDDPGIKPNTQTIGLVYGKMALDQLTSCLGSGIPSDRTLAMYSSKESTLSETGSVATLTAPGLMAFASVAGEVCEDLLKNEANAPRMFIGFGFGQSSLPNQGALQDAMRRLALSCWSREEEQEEADIVMSSVNSAFQGATGPSTPHDAALFMCTSMAAALESMML